MKKASILFLLIGINALQVRSQCVDYCLDFDDMICLDHVIIDTVANPGNIWQIGPPQKPLFNIANSPPNAIVTNTVGFYPVNNNSSFIIQNLAGYGIAYGCEIFNGFYNVQSDSLKDYGSIEFSPDKGTSWIDLINDTNYNSNIQWQIPKPVLTGNSHGWRFFDVMLIDFGSIFNLHYGDTILFRFTFKSDSIPNSLGGLMFDDFCFFEYVEGVSEIHFKPVKSTIYPNPSGNMFTIAFENPNSDAYQLNIYDINSKLVFTMDKIADNSIVVDARSFTPGVYFYKLTNMYEPKRSWGKFVVGN